MDVSFAGKPCIDASFSLEPGFSPSTGSITLSKRETPDSLFTGENGPYALRMADEKSSIVIQELYVKEIEPDEGPDGSAIYRISIQDRRWRWKHKYICGEFNTLTKDKKSVEPFSRKQTQDLINDLCFALGEFPEGISSVGVGADSSGIPRFTNIKWDFDNPAQELEKIFKELGYVLSLASNSTLKVYRKGVGSHVVQQNRLINNKKGKKDWEKPDKVIIAGGRNIRKVTIENLVAVVKSDGTISGTKEDDLVDVATAIESWGLNEIKCRQAAAKFLENRDAYDVVEKLRVSDEVSSEDATAADPVAAAAERAAKVQKRRKIMQECFLKWYRLPRARYPTQRFSRLSDTTTNFFRLPILKEIPEFFKANESSADTLMYSRKPIVEVKIQQKKMLPIGEASNYAGITALVDRNANQPIQQYRNPSLYSRLMIEDSDIVSLDYENGVVKFKEPIGKWIRNLDGSILGSTFEIPASLLQFPEAQNIDLLRLGNGFVNLTFAHEDHFVEYKNLFPYTEDSYFYVYPNDNNEQPTLTKKFTAKVIKRPELRLFIDGNTKLNLEELNKQAKLIAEEYFNNFFPPTATEYVYAGFIEARPDGKVTSVNYSFTDSGGLTEVKESDLTTTSKLVFGSPPRFYGGRSGNKGSAFRTSSILGNRSAGKTEELEKRVYELEREIKRLGGPPPSGGAPSFGLINTSMGAYIPLADSENKRLHTIFCRIVSYDTTTGAYTIDRVGPAIGPTWNSTQEGWEMGGGSGKFLEWTPA